MERGVLEERPKHSPITLLFVAIMSLRILMSTNQAYDVSHPVIL